DYSITTSRTILHLNSLITQVHHEAVAVNMPENDTTLVSTLSAFSLFVEGLVDRWRGRGMTVKSGIPMRMTTVLPVGSSMGALALWLRSATGQKAGMGTPLSSSRELPLSVLAPWLPGVLVSAVPLLDTLQHVIPLALEKEHGRSPYPITPSLALQPSENKPAISQPYIDHSETCTLEKKGAGAEGGREIK
ncbi:Argininosuccinate synthase, partial [Dissostichus eleginoides]